MNPEHQLGSGTAELPAAPLNQRKSLRQRWRDWWNGWDRLFLVLIVWSLANRAMYLKPGEALLQMPTREQTQTILVGTVLAAIMGLILIGVCHIIDRLKRLRSPNALKVTLLIVLMLATTITLILVGVTGIRLGLN